jgi:hypothetical protein
VGEPLLQLVHPIVQDIGWNDDDDVRAALVLYLRLEVQLKRHNGLRKRTSCCHRSTEVRRTVTAIIYLFHMKRKSTQLVLQAAEIKRAEHMPSCCNIKWCAVCR